MEEILASIRRIIADDDGSRTARAPSPTPPPAAPPPPAAAAAPPSPPPAPPSDGNSQDDIDAMFAEPAAVTPPPPPPPPAPEPPAADVLDLTEEMTAAPEVPEPAPSFRTIDAASDVVFTERPPEPAPAPPPPRAAEGVLPQPTFEPEIMSNTTAAAVDSAFNALAHTVLGNNARTLEDLVKEMLRPMLKSWLDDNLPSLVERIVRTEIERVSRGRG